MDPSTNHASGVRVIDSATKEVLDFKAQVVVLAASTLESTRLLLLSKSARRRPNGLANSSGAVGHYFCEHVMGPRASGMMPTLRGSAITNDDGRPQSTYIVRFRNITDKHPDFIRGYGFQGGSGSAEYPDHAHTTPGIGSSFKQKVRADHPTPINISGVRRSAGAEGESGRARSGGEGRVGHPGAAVQLPLRRQRAEDGEGHGGHGRGDARRPPAPKTSRYRATC